MLKAAERRFSVISAVKMSDGIASSRVKESFAKCDSSTMGALTTRPEELSEASASNLNEENGRELVPLMLVVWAGTTLSAVWFEVDVVREFELAHCFRAQTISVNGRHTSRLCTSALVWSVSKVPGEKRAIHLTDVALQLKRRRSRSSFGRSVKRRSTRETRRAAPQSRILLR
jgi:hypothetical protein